VHVHRCTSVWVCVSVCMCAVINISGIYSESGHLESCLSLRVIKLNNISVFNTLAGLVFIWDHSYGTIA